MLRRGLFPFAQWRLRYTGTLYLRGVQLALPKGPPHVQFRCMQNCLGKAMRFALKKYTEKKAVAYSSAVLFEVATRFGIAYVHLNVLPGRGKYAFL